VVYVAVYLMVNAKLLKAAREMGTVTYLNAAECALLDVMNFAEPPLERAWEYWCRRAGV